MLGPEAFVAATSVVAAGAAIRTAVDSRNYRRAQKQKRQELGSLQPSQFGRTVEMAKSLVAGPGQTLGRSGAGAPKNPHVPLIGFREQQRRQKTGDYSPLRRRL